jgi:hypothetical protein
MEAVSSCSREVISMRAGPALCILILIAYPATAETLISESEARLPADTVTKKAIFLGPKIEIISPQSSGMIKSPLHFKLRFQSRAGTSVDIDTLSVTYLRKPAQNLTMRVLPFATKDGIDMPRAEVPSGKHRIWIDVKDTNGDAGWTELNFEVPK